MRESRRRSGAGLVALAVSITLVPTVAVAGGPSAGRGIVAAPTGHGVATAVPSAWSQALLVKKKKKKSSPGLTPEKAEPKRQAIRDAVKSDVEAENWEAAADEAESNAALLGDPVTMQEAAEYRLEQAAKDRDVDAANAAIDTARVALDMLHFYDAVDSGDAVSDWLPIDPATASSSISDVEGIIERAEELIAEIEAEQELDDSAGPVEEEKKKKRKKRGPAKPGTVLIAVGSVLAGVGAGGLGLGIAGTVTSNQKQKEVESLTLPQDQARVDELDEEGARANLLAYVGYGIGVAGLAAGVPMIVIGVMRRKKGGPPPESARLRVMPAMSRSFGGVSLHGRF